MTASTPPTTSSAPTTSSTPTTRSTSSTEARVPPTMIAAVARRYGAPADVIAVEEVPVPTPGPGDVLVAVAASSLNALDVHFVTGTPYLVRPTAGVRRPKRIVPGADLAGTVVAVGSDVHDLAPGDRVFGESQRGGCAPYAVVAASHVVPLPAGVSFESAAATPVAGLTAIQALRTHAAVQPGESVLINGAAGGVGTFAMQIAKASGARVTAVCSTRNVDMVRELGADEVVDYTAVRLVDVVAGAEPYDVMIDNVGNHTAAECIGMLRPGGRYVAVSGPKKNRWLGPVPHIVRLALRFRRSDRSLRQFVASPNRTDLTALAELLADGRVVPRIDRVIGLDDVAGALVELATGHARAKIVVVPQPTIG